MFPFPKPTGWHYISRLTKNPSLTWDQIHVHVTILHNDKKVYNLVVLSTATSDGIKVTSDGTVFLALDGDGKGVVGIFTAGGKQLGWVGGSDDRRFVTNMVIGGDGYVYVTAANTLARFACNCRPVQ
jgi:sugar lactone lactonase YvrE